MLDIKQRAVADTIQFQLVDADDTPLVDEAGDPCMATVHGPGSKVYARATAAKQARMMSRLQRGKDLSLTAEESARVTAEFLAAITVSLDLDYDDLEGHAKFLGIYGDASIGFIAEQVAKKCGDWGNFTRGSAKS